MSEVEPWELPGARVDTLIVAANRAEVERSDVGPAMTKLRKLLTRDVAPRLQGRVILVVRGFDDDPRELHQIPKVREWMQEIDRQFPLWFYFMDLGPQSTLAFVAFSLCEYEQVRGGSVISSGSLRSFMTSHFMALNDFASWLRLPQEEVDAISRRVGAFFG